MGLAQRCLFGDDDQPKKRSKKRRRLSSSRAEGARRRDDAMERVDEAANIEWAAAADIALLEVARRQSDLTSEDVAAAIPLGFVTHEKRAIGPVMTRGRTAGYVEPTDRFVPAQNPTRHCAPIRVWRSCVFIG